MKHLDAKMERILKMVENTTELVNNLRDRDVYSIICSLLYDLKDIPQYSTISELCYMLDVDSFLNLIQYMEGRTIKIPTKEEFADTMQVLRLFHYSEIEKRPWKDCVLLAGYESGSGKLAKNKLERLKKTLANTNIGNREY